MAATDVVSSLQREVELAREGLKSVDEDIKKLTGRDPSEARGPVGRGRPVGRGGPMGRGGLVGNRRVMKRDFGERISGPPLKRFNSGTAFNRLGPRVNERQLSGQLESDGEEEEDDSKKPTLQSSIVATPAPSREQQDVKTDKKTQTRNKRMFGVLLGTLQKFKENSSKEAARERKRKQIDKKLEEAAIKEREQAIRQKKELFFARREQQTKLEELERKMEVAEMLEEWEDHDRKLSKFIRTNTKPHIFYLPVKHNDYTLGLLEKTAEHVEDEIKKRRQEVREILKKPEDRKDAEQEAGNETRDNQEPDVLQEVEHSDNEGNRRGKRVKGGHRQVVLTGDKREVKMINDEVDEEGKSRNEKVNAEDGSIDMIERSDQKEVEEKADSKVEVAEERKRDVEVSEVNEGGVEVKGMERVESEKVETEEVQEGKERDVEMSDTSEGKLESQKKEEDDTKVEAVGEITMEQEKNQEKEQQINEDFNEHIGANKNPEGHAEDGDFSEAPTSTEEVKLSSGDKDMDMVMKTDDLQKDEDEPSSQ